ncbi:MAG: hypothetical protein AAF411_09775 [Myxococcota bacterium]
MSRRLVFALFALIGCRTPAYGPTERQQGRTEVVFVGGLHRSHLEAPYDLDQLTLLLQRARPEALLVQCPPELIDAVREAPRTHPWSVALPDVGRALAFAQGRGLPVEAISAYSPAFAERSRRYRAEHPAGPDDRAYRRARRYFLRRSAREGARTLEWVASPLYSRLARRVALTRASALRRSGEDALILDWSAHESQYRRGLSYHRGKRIAVVFDARQRWRLEDRTPRWVSVLDARGFLTDNGE